MGAELFAILLGILLTPIAWAFLKVIMEIYEEKQSRNVVSNEVFEEIRKSIQEVMDDVKENRNDSL